MKCGHCYGQGYKAVTFSHGVSEQECTYCKGSGKFERNKMENACQQVIIDSIDTAQLFNSLMHVDKETRNNVWKALVLDMHCPCCRISGMWWHKLSGQSEVGFELYRCEDCKQLIMIKVPG